MEKIAFTTELTLQERIVTQEQIEIERTKERTLLNTCTMLGFVKLLGIDSTSCKLRVTDGKIVFPEPMEIDSKWEALGAVMMGDSPALVVQNSYAKYKEFRLVLPLR